MQQSEVSKIRLPDVFYIPGALFFTFFETIETAVGIGGWVGWGLFVGYALIVGL